MRGASKVGCGAAIPCLRELGNAVNLGRRAVQLEKGP